MALTIKDVLVAFTLSIYFCSICGEILIDEIDEPKYTSRIRISSYPDISLGYNVIGDQIPDFVSTSFSDNARVGCGSGVWLFYPTSNYNSKPAYFVEVIFMPERGCFLFKSHVENKLHSLRTVGNAMDSSESTVTLYEFHRYQGREERSEGLAMQELKILDRKSKSMIITGSEPYTFYGEPEFKFDDSKYSRKAICVTPSKKTPPGTPTFIQDLALVRMNYNWIRSFHSGCVADLKTEAPDRVDEQQDFNKIPYNWTST